MLDIRYLYLKDPKQPGRRITVARILNEDKTVLRFAYAVCRPKSTSCEGDTFTRYVGRQITSGRLEKESDGYTYTLPLGADQQPIGRVLDALASDPNAPQCVRRIAKSYLSN